MHTKKIFYVVALLVAIATISQSCQSKDTSAPVVSQQHNESQPPLFPSPLSLPSTPFDIKLAWFYKSPPSDSMTLVADQFQFYILTAGDEITRDQFIQLGAQYPILEYFRFDAINDPGSCTAQPHKNQVAYRPGDFCYIDTEHPDWFLLDKNGQRIYRAKDDHSYVFMDPGNPNWRSFYLERVQASMKTGWGGVFLDNVETTLSRREERNEVPFQYSDDKSYQAAIQGFLKYLRDNYFQPQKKALYANLVARRDEADWTKYLANLDGVMHEGWAIDWPNGYRPVEVWEKQMTLAEDTQKMGKFILLISHGEKDNLELQQFAFASYLLVNQGLSAFRYSNEYNEIWLYDNYNIDLGQPLGARHLNGTIWRRDFTKGFVEVDPKNHKVTLKQYSR